jgi:hypothetical protein
MLYDLIFYAVIALSIMVLVSFIDPPITLAMHSNLVIRPVSIIADGSARWLAASWRAQRIGRSGSGTFWRDL